MVSNISGFYLIACALFQCLAMPALAADMTVEERDAMFDKYVNTMPPSLNMSYDQLVAQGKQMNKVIVLGGYSGQGYQNPDALRTYLKQIVSQAGDGAMYVIGGTGDGIGAGYKAIPEIAKELGFKNVKTAGIVSRNAAQYGIEKMDSNVFVNTGVNDWNVKGPDGKSLMVKIAKDTGGQLIYARGGEVSANELKEAASEGVPTTVLRDPNLSASETVAAKKLAKANPNLDPSSSEFKAKLQSMMQAADKPTADLQNSAPTGMKIVEQPTDLKVAGRPSSFSSLSRSIGAAADKAIKGAAGKIGALSTGAGLAADALEHEKAEAISKGKCPGIGANSDGTFEALANYDSDTWSAVARDCQKQGKNLNFFANVQKLKKESGSGIGQASCKADGTVKIVHSGNGMSTEVKFSSENELQEIKTQPADGKSSSYSITYYKDPKKGWRVSTFSKQGQSADTRDESWNSFVSRYACSVSKCKDEDLHKSVDSVDEITTSSNPFGLAASEYSVKAAASMNLARRLLLGSSGAQPSYQSYCKTALPDGAKAPQDVIFSGGGGSASGSGPGQSRGSQSAQ